MIEIGGRKLQIIASGTVKHDYWLMAQIRLAGIDTVEMPAGKSTEVAVEGILDRVLASGKAMVLLGGLLMPAELPITAWTEDVAAEMTTFLEALTANEDKTAIRGLVAQAMVGFFRSALVSLRTSRTSSPETSASELRGANAEPPLPPSADSEE